MSGQPTSDYSESAGPLPAAPQRAAAPRRTLTGIIGAVCFLPLKAIISACVKLGVSPNVLTFVGMVINITAAVLLGYGHFRTGAFIILLANIFDFIDGKVARAGNIETAFGGFWDSVLDRFSDITLFIGLVGLYAQKGRTDYVIITALAMMFSVMTSYTRARAESLIDKCKVGFMERPERIVLLMIGAFTYRMAAVVWVILVLSIVTVADRIYYTWRVLNNVKEGKKSVPALVLWRAVFWTGERGTWQYDLWVLAILAFIVLVPPAWLGDPMTSGAGLLGKLFGH